jgi:two-component system sensor histidine kinase PilS (NtrC family)
MGEELSDLDSQPEAATPLAPPVSPVQVIAEEERQAARRLQLFMGTRLGVATLLLGGTLLVALDNSRGADSFTPRFLMTLIAAIYGGSLLFSLWLLGSTNKRRAAIAQVVGDLIITTALVYITGGAGSGFTFLYGVAVLMAAMVVGPAPARVAGATAIVLYTALVTSLSLSWLPPPPDQSIEAYQLPLTELVYAALLNVLGLCLVTLLAGSLSARLLSAGGQLRRAEANAASLARLNADIVRSLTSGLLTTDLAGHIRTVNPAAVEMLGTDLFSLIGEPVANYLPIDVSIIVNRRSDSEGGIARAEARATRLNGTKFPAGYSLNALNSIEGTLIGALVVFQDLSEIVQLREVAVRGERLGVLGRLSAGLAHEIRNPLSSISGSVELVRDSARLGDEDRRLLGIVLREVERLDDLVSTMLLVGRPREPLRGQQDLRLIVAEVVEMARRGPASDAGVITDYTVPNDPVYAWVDGDQIRQVLWNLVKNALQASPRGATVHVQTRSAPPDGALFEVIDQGRGIDASQREKVYDMFHSERTHGAGIGLALVRQIIDAHHGAIDIVSEHNRGATFVVTLPAHAEARFGSHSGRATARPSAASA